MTDKDLNIKYICERTLLDKNDKLVPIILDMIQESYKAGLCQSEHDNTMELLEENKQLKDNWNKLKRWLYEDHCLYVREVARNSTYQKVLEKMEEIEKGEK